jgi:AcrR family transcriptional regulator
MKAMESIARRPGRPLSFDRDKALDAAMRLFWRTGYETTSVADLTQAMGITAPSLYTAFHDKETLFLECLRKYTDPAGYKDAALIAETASAREAAQTLLEFSARWFTQPDAPPGCLVASAASTGSASSERVRAAVADVRKATQAALQRRVEEDVQTGKLPETANARALSSLTVAVIQGMSTLARDGASQSSLLELVSTTMAAWPVSLA